MSSPLRTMRRAILRSRGGHALVAYDSRLRSYARRKGSNVERLPVTVTKSNPTGVGDALRVPGMGRHDSAPAPAGLFSRIRRMFRRQGAA